MTCGAELGRDKMASVKSCFAAMTRARSRTRLRRLLVEAKCAMNVTALDSEINAYERTDANHTRLTFVTDAAKNKFALALPSFGKHKVLDKVLNGVLPITVLSSFGLV